MGTRRAGALIRVNGTLKPRVDRAASMADRAGEPSKMEGRR